MSKFGKIIDKRISRTDLSDPHNHIPYAERLYLSGAVDLTDNHIIIDLGNGYSKIVPIDINKKCKKPMELQK